MRAAVHQLNRSRKIVYKLYKLYYESLFVSVGYAAIQSRSASPEQLYSSGGGAGSGGAGQWGQQLRSGSYTSLQWQTHVEGQLALFIALQDRVVHLFRVE